MFSRSFTHQSLSSKELSIETAEALANGRGVADRRERSRFRSIPGPLRTAGSRLRRRPRGHVVGHAVGGPPALSFDGRPRGHVVARAVGDAPPLSFDGRPRGHVVGHAVGGSTPLSFDGRPRGHVVGRPVVDAIGITR